ncbi:MAG TPA: hypothetical protein VFO65_08015 [Acidimicrobiales bacterium]|nr:hypothetical protein [Acidimicrobiales bacterium]
MTDERDEMLGAALRDLPVPDHAPGFWDDLEQRLAETAPEPVELSRRRRLPGLAVLAAAACAAVALALVADRRGDDESRVVTEPTTTVPGPGAAGLTGRIVIDLPEGQPDTEQDFTVAADRSYSLRARAGRSTMAYDAASGRAVVVSGPAPYLPEPFAEVRTGLVPGPPDAGLAYWSGLRWDLSDYVAGQAAAGNPDIEEVRFLGRPAWSLSTAVAPHQLAETGDRLDVVVDRETGLVLRRVERRGDQVLQRDEVTEVAVLDRVDRSAFDPPLPAGVEPVTHDQRFRPAAPGSTARLAALSGLPAPEGYRPARAWVLEGEGDPTGVEASNPPSTDVAVVEYADGWRRLYVSLRTMVGGAEAWTDPFAGEGQPLSPVELAIEPGGGAAGGRGAVVVDPVTLPHAWATFRPGPGPDGYVITAAGPLDDAGLRRLVSAIRPR